MSKAQSSASDTTASPPEAPAAPPPLMSGGPMAFGTPLELHHDPRREPAFNIHEFRREIAWHKRLSAKFTAIMTMIGILFGLFVGRALP